MVDISAENFQNALVYTITVGNRELFWVRMIDVQKGLGVKNMSDLVRKEIHGIFETKTPTEEQIRKYKRSEKEIDKESKSNFKYDRSDLMSRMIKNCRGEKKRGEKNEFRIKLGFAPNDIIMTKEESVLTKIIQLFTREKILQQHKVLKY